MLLSSSTGVSLSLLLAEASEVKAPNTVITVQQSVGDASSGHKVGRICVCVCTFLSQVCVHYSECKSKVYLVFPLSKGPADLTGGQQVRITWLTLQVEETPQQTAATPLSEVALLVWFAATSFSPFHWIWLASKVIFNRDKCTDSSYCLFWRGNSERNCQCLIMLSESAVALPAQPAPWFCLYKWTFGLGVFGRELGSHTGSVEQFSFVILPFWMFCAPVGIRAESIGFD